MGAIVLAQIGGLAIATFVELLLVPVLYAIFVLDLKIVKWEESSGEVIPADMLVWAGSVAAAPDP